MKAVRAWFHRCFGLFRKLRSDAEFAVELESHLQLHFEDNLRAGMTPGAARRDALIKLGGIEQTKENYRDRRSLPALERLQTVLQDVRYAVRLWRKSPSFAATVVLVLALAIGVNTSIFTLYDAIALRPLPVKDANHVVRIARSYRYAWPGHYNFEFAYPEYEYLRDHQRSFTGLIAASDVFDVPAKLPIAINDSPQVLPPASAQQSSAAEEPATVSCQLVSANFFPELAAEPAFAHLFAEGDTTSAAPVVVVRNSFWRRRLASDPQIIGKTLLLRRTRFVITGVVSADFIGIANPPFIPDIWVPALMQRQIAPGADWLHDWTVSAFQVVARLKPAVSMKAGSAEVAVLFAQLTREHAEVRQIKGTLAFALTPARYMEGASDIRIRAVVFLVMATVAMVLLIACANVAGLLLARSVSRRREITIRLAIGATRRRLIQQLLTESAVLGLFPGIAGLLLSNWCCQILWFGLLQGIARVFPQFPLVTLNLSPDVRVFIYTLFVAVIAGFGLGLLPALQVSRPNLIEALKEEEPAFAGAARRGGWFHFNVRELLITLQVLACISLLAAAGLLVRGLLNASKVNLGFDVAKLFAIDIDDKYFETDTVRRTEIARQLTERLRALPGVQSVGLGSIGDGGEAPFELPDRRAGSIVLPPKAFYSVVSPEFFPTMGIAIVRGRNFALHEVEHSAPLVIVSRATARLFWPGEDPIGRRITTKCGWCGPLPRSVEVIGVAGDVRGDSPSRIDPTRLYFLANASDNLPVLVRTYGDSRTVMHGIPAMLAAIDSHLPEQSSVIRVAEFVETRAGVERLLSKLCSTLATTLALIALVLSLAGICSLIAYAVARRTREIGVRIALGASRADVLRLMLGSGARPVLIGAIAGLMGAAVVGRVLAALALKVPEDVPDLLYGASPWDASVFLGVFAVVLFLSLLAAYIPARRAIKVDPMVALRYE